jgi:hypothetical protein
MKVLVWVVVLVSQPPPLFFFICGDPTCVGHLPKAQTIGTYNCAAS